MKTNVDLTANGDFSGLNGVLRASQTLSDVMNKKIRKLRGEKYPWSFSSKVTGRNGELFYTGNKEERQLKREFEARDLYACDCCGKLNTKKWDFKYSLCIECSNNLDEMESLKNIWVLKGYGINAVRRW